jgi:hypothetical protein
MSQGMNVRNLELALIRGNLVIQQEMRTVTSEVTKNLKFLVEITHPMAPNLNVIDLLYLYVMTAEEHNETLIEKVLVQFIEKTVSLIKTQWETIVRSHETDDLNKQVAPSLSSTFSLDGGDEMMMSPTTAHDRKSMSSLPLSCSELTPASPSLCHLSFSLFSQINSHCGCNESRSMPT